MFRAYKHPRRQRRLKDQISDSDGHTKAKFEVGVVIRTVIALSIYRSFARDTRIYSTDLVRVNSNLHDRRRALWKFSQTTVDDDLQQPPLNKADDLVSSLRYENRSWLTSLVVAPVFDSCRQAS